MPPRQTGQLDQISQAIGDLQGQVSAISRYTHDREHAINNVNQKIDSLSSQITREVTRMKTELQIQMKAMDERIAALEKIAATEAGERGLLVGFLHSPIVGWLVAAAAFVWAALTGRQG